MSREKGELMKITWLGQAGLLFDNGKTKIMVDPYLSHSVEKVNPQNFRRVPINRALFDVTPDIMIFTHNHLDHYDPETAPLFLEKTERPMTVLCPSSVWQNARQHGKSHNYVLFNRHTEWSENGFRFRAVKAVHSDADAIGVIMEDLTENKVYYITGDTLYSREIFPDLPKKIDLVFLPINGVGNNMNTTDAARFFRDCGAKWAVPYHVGMFDEISPASFDVNEKIILDIYKEKEV
jgi:L-ascorbate 6-phosphate lactonase